MGLNLTHTRADLARSMFEGLGFATRRIFETYEHAGLRARRIAAVGGGTRNPVWVQAVSDIAGRSQEIRQQRIGASYGDALLAAIGVGAVRPEAIERWNQVEREVAPDSTLSQFYEEQYQTFCSLDPRLASAKSGAFRTSQSNALSRRDK